MFKVDRKLNYGRHLFSNFISSVDKVERCVDLGAGQGDDLLAVRSFFNDVELHGLEWSEKNIEILRSKDIAPFSIDFEKDKFPFEDSSLDLIISNQMMEHCKEVFWVLHEMSRSLKVGGHIIFGFPNLASLHNRLLLLFGKHPTCNQNHSAHIRAFSKNDFIKLLNVFNNGYEVVDFKGSNFYPFSPVLAKPLAKTFPNMAYSIFFLVKKVKNYNNEFIRFPKEQALETNFYLGE